MKVKCYGMGKGIYFDMADTLNGMFITIDEWEGINGYKNETVADFVHVYFDFYENRERKEEIFKSIIKELDLDNPSSNIILTTNFEMEYSEFPQDEYDWSYGGDEKEKNKKPVPEFKDWWVRDKEFLENMGFFCVKDIFDYAPCNYSLFIYLNERARELFTLCDETWLKIDIPERKTDKPTSEKKTKKDIVKAVNRINKKNNFDFEFKVERFEFIEKRFNNNKEEYIRNKIASKEYDMELVKEDILQFCEKLKSMVEGMIDYISNTYQD